MQTRHNQRRDKYRQQGPARCEHDLHVNVIKLHVTVHECITTFMARPTVQKNQVFISNGFVDHLKCVILLPLWQGRLFRKVYFLYQRGSWSIRDAF